MSILILAGYYVNDPLFKLVFFMVYQVLYN